MAAATSGGTTLLGRPFFTRAESRAGPRCARSSPPDCLLQCPGQDGVHLVDLAGRQREPFARSGSCTCFAEPGRGSNRSPAHGRLALPDAAGTSLAGGLPLGQVGHHDTAGVDHGGERRRRGLDSSQRLGRHRWRVERSIAWLVSNRRLATRYERWADLLTGLLHLACELICARKLKLL